MDTLRTGSFQNPIQTIHPKALNFKILNPKPQTAISGFQTSRDPATDIKHQSSILPVIGRNIISLCRLVTWSPSGFRADLVLLMRK